MVNQAVIQSKIWSGYGKAAQRLGIQHQFYRPRAANLLAEGGSRILLENSTPLGLDGPGMFLGDPLFTRYVSLNAEDMKYGKPNKYGKATWYAVMDGTGLQAGDYLLGLTANGDIVLEGGGDLLQEGNGNLQLEGPTKGTYFIAALQSLLPILVVECNRVVSIYRPQTQTGVGQQGYGGTTDDNTLLLAQGVPCSILQGTKGEKSETNLPGDTRSPWFSILIPASVGKIVTDDIMIDDLGQRYVLSSVELSDLGFRITAMLALT